MSRIKIAESRLHSKCSFLDSKLSVNQDRWQDHPYLSGVFPTKKHKLEFAAFASSLALFSILFVGTPSTSSALSIGAKGMPHVPTVEPDFQAETIKSYADNVVPKKGGLTLSSFEGLTQEGDRNKILFVKTV